MIFFGTRFGILKFRWQRFPGCQRNGTGNASSLPCPKPLLEDFQGLFFFIRRWVKEDGLCFLSYQNI
jgi:hypothetical protein